MINSIDEAIAHAKEKAEEQKKQGSICCDSLEDTIRAEECLECAEEHEQLASWLTELKELRNFAKWVTDEVLDDYFEENSGAFAEIACRKLTKLEYIVIDGNVYKKKENDK